MLACFHRDLVRTSKVKNKYACIGVCVCVRFLGFLDMEAQSGYKNFLENTYGNFVKNVYINFILLK